MVCGRWDIREVDQTRKHVFRNAKSISALQVSCPSQTSTPSMLDSNPVPTLIVAIITVQLASDRVTSLSQSDAWIFKKPIPKTREPVLVYRRLYVTLLMSENYLIFFLGIIIPATASASIRSRRIEQILEIVAPVLKDSGSKRIISWPSPCGITAPRRIQSARKISASCACAVGI